MTEDQFIEIADMINNLADDIDDRRKQYNGEPGLRLIYSSVQDDVDMLKFAAAALAEAAIGLGVDENAVDARTRSLLMLRIACWLREYKIETLAKRGMEA